MNKRSSLRSLYSARLEFLDSLAFSCLIRPFPLNRMKIDHLLKKLPHREMTVSDTSTRVDHQHATRSIPSSSRYTTRVHLACPPRAKSPHSNSFLRRVFPQHFVIHGTYPAMWGIVRFAGKRCFVDCESKQDILSK